MLFLFVLYHLSRKKLQLSSHLLEKSAEISVTCDSNVSKSCKKHEHADSNVTLGMAALVSLTVTPQIQDGIRLNFGVAVFLTSIKRTAKTLGNLSKIYLLNISMSKLSL